MPVSFPIPLAEEVSFWKAIAPQGDKGSFLWWQMTHQIPWFKNFANESNEKAWDWRGGEVKKRVEAEAQGSMLEISTLSTPSAGEQVREIRWLRERWGWKKKHDNEATRITWNKRWVRSNWISNFFRSLLSIMSNNNRGEGGSNNTSGNNNNNGTSHGPTGVVTTGGRVQQPRPQIKGAGPRIGGQGSGSTILVNSCQVSTSS